eukprot:gene39151-24297_t
MLNGHQRDRGCESQRSEAVDKDDQKNESTKQKTKQNRLKDIAGAMYDMLAERG